LEALKKDGYLPMTLLLRRSYFDDCRGERFEQAILALAMHTLKTVLEREFEDFDRCEFKF
jgi:hypothetical protein